MRGEDFVRRYAAAFSAGDPKAFAALYAPGATLEHPMAGRLEGRDAILSFESPMFGAFSAIEWKAARVVEQGDWIAVEFTIGATNTGPMQTPQGPIPATNRRVTLSASAFFRLDASGSIEQERRYFDAASFFKQLGLA